MKDKHVFFLIQNAQQIHGPFLVVVPLSTLSNWAKEFRKWLPDMNVIVYVGTRASREVRHISIEIFGIFASVCLDGESIDTSYKVYEVFNSFQFF